MITSKYFILFSLIINVSIFAQTDYPLAPEIWSEPKIIKEIETFAGPYNSIRNVSITADGNKLFISGIAFLEKTDSGWTNPVYLNDRINSNLAGWPCISKDGNRLFFSKYVGGWYLFYSDWDSLTNDWFPAVNCGKGVNRTEVILCASPDDTTIIYGREGQTFLSTWDSATNTYSEGRGFPNDDNPYSSEHGFFFTKDFKKIYNDRSRPDTLIDGTYYINYDISVSYQSEFDNSFYWPSQILSFCLKSDSLYDIGIYKGKTESSPSLTADGKTMYFTANYSGQLLVYESYMLVDENGDTVTTVNDRFPSIDNFTLSQNYPNPFNPSTIINYTLNKEGLVTLIIYDSLGKRIAEPLSERKPKGTYKYTFNAKEYNLSSGIYYYQLFLNRNYIVKKMALVK